MFTHKHLVVVVDSAEDNMTALQKAELLMAKVGARLTLFSSGYNSTLANNHPFDTDTTEKAKEAYIHRMKLSLEEKAEPLREKGYEVDCVTMWDKHPSQAIIHYLEDNPTDLVVKSTHHQNVMQRTLFSHLDWDLIRYSPVPLLLTKGASWNHGQTLSITASVDPIHTNEKPAKMDQEILADSLRLAKELEAELSVLHVYDPTPLLIYLDQPTVDAGEISEQIRKQHQDALNELVAPYDIDPTHVYLETGSPGTMIPDFLYQNDSHLVVMGALARKGLDRILIGHTAERILDRINADIMVVKVLQEEGS